MAWKVDKNEKTDNLFFLIPTPPPVPHMGVESGGEHIGLYQAEGHAKQAYALTKFPL